MMRESRKDAKLSNPQNRLKRIKNFVLYMSKITILKPMLKR
jgi:hypothetical protein